MNENYFSFTLIIASIFGSSLAAVIAVLIYTFVPSYHLHSQYNLISNSKQNQTFVNQFPSINYTNKWYKEEHSTYETDFSNCPTCNYKILINASNIPSDANSSPRDAVILFDSELPTGIVPFLRSFRMTHSQARIFYLCGKRSIDLLGSDTQSILNKCGVTFIDYGHFDSLWWENNMLLRWQVIRDFLIQHIPSLDRVILSYTTNVFFQADPFRQKIKKDKLYFIQEDSPISSSVWEKSDFRRVSGKYYQTYFRKPIITAQIVLGGCKEVAVFLDALITEFSFAYMKLERVTEQGFFMYTAYRIMPNHSPKVKIEFLRQDDGYAGLAFYHQKNSVLVPGSFCLDNGICPSTLFNFDHREHFHKKYLYLCPKGSLNIRNYMYKMPDGLNPKIDSKK